MTGADAGSAGVRLKSVALPAEHGGWGLLGEPLALGMLAAPSWAGLGVGLLALGAFLARHPLKLALADWRRRSQSPRTAAAERFVLLYGTVAAAGLALAATGRPGFWLPLAMAAPFALVQLAYDAGHQGRQLLPELMGAIALSSVAAAVMRAAGFPLGPSLAAWAILAVKGVGAVLYVRARLRSDRGLAAARGPALASHVAALLLGIALASAGYAPWLVAVALATLLVRAALGLSRHRRQVRPQVVGLQELAYGSSFVVIAALGYALGF